ncbi:MAG: hypothetical protein ACK5LO_07805 [Leucobacter sp.]
MRVGFSEVVERSGLRKSAIAERAGVTRATLYRAISETADMRLDTVEEIALACGLQPVLAFEPLSALAAADAGRVLLEGLEVAGDQAVQAWVNRLNRWAGEDPLRIAVEAGRASTLLYRRGAIGMRGDISIDRLASAGYASGEEWALSGSAALEAMSGEPEEEPVTVFWTPAPRRVCQLLSDTLRIESHGLPASQLIICEPSVLTLVGASSIGGINLVSPVQAIIDCTGLHDRQRERAVSIAGEW